MICSVNNIFKNIIDITCYNIIDITCYNIIDI